jgi:hypothetical protein
MIVVAASVTTLPGFGQYARNRYALILQDEPVASRFVTREQMRTAGADGYRRQLTLRQNSVHQELARRGVPVISSVSEVLNAVFVSARRIESRNWPRSRRNRRPPDAADAFDAY